MDFESITGCGISSNDHTIPARIPRMIGFVAMPRSVLFQSFLPLPASLSGEVSESVITAIILYIGTVPTIMSAAIAACP